MRNRAAYQRVYNEGRRYGSRSFLLFVHARTPEEAWGDAAPADAPLHRLGTAVSRKIGSAVVRNRCKRVLREWFRLHRHLWRWPQGDAQAGGRVQDVLAGMDLVIVPRRGVDVNALSLQDVTGELTPAARRAWKDCVRHARAELEAASGDAVSPATPPPPTSLA